MEIPNSGQNLQSNPKKRPSDNNVSIQNSNYFKIRAVLKDLRPHFLEVLRTPDFQTSKSACEIGQQMKLLMNLYEELTSDTFTIEKCKNIADDKKPIDIKPVEPPPPFVRKASEERPVIVEDIKDVKLQGSYIVGGSAFGWNFIMYHGGKLAVYYGRTKEAFRAANPIIIPKTEES